MVGLSDEDEEEEVEEEEEEEEEEEDDDDDDEEDEEEERFVSLFDAEFASAAPTRATSADTFADASLFPLELTIATSPPPPPLTVVLLLVDFALLMDGTV